MKLSECLDAALVTFFLTKHSNNLLSHVYNFVPTMAKRQ